MKFHAWREDRDHRAITTASGLIVANHGETVIVIVARKGESVFALLDELTARVDRDE